MHKLVHTGFHPYQHPPHRSTTPPLHALHTDRLPLLLIYCPDHYIRPCLALYGIDGRRCAADSRADDVRDDGDCDVLVWLGIAGVLGI